jgi:hypothetical protein
MDRRPDEVVRNGRKEERDPLVDFEFVLGWTLDAAPVEPLRFERSRLQQLWGEHTGRITMGPVADETAVTVRPPAPIPIRSRFDGINIWALQAEGMEPGPTGLEILVEDASEKEIAFGVGPVPRGSWRLLHLRLSGSRLTKIQFPCRFTGLRLTRKAGETGCDVFLDSLSFYQEQFPTVEIELRPRRNIPFPPGIREGVHAGEEALPFPVSEDTILPPPGPVRSRVQLHLTEEGVFDFNSTSADGRLQYQIDGAAPHHGVAVTWDGLPVGRFLVEAGLTGLTNETQDVTVFRREADDARIEFGHGESRHYSVRGKTLILDLIARGGGGDGLTLGCVEDVAAWNPVALPGLSEPGSPLVFLGWVPAPGKGSAPACFVSVCLDWYRSCGSTIYRPTHDGDRRPTIGGVRYEAASDGKRHPVYERILLSVSPRLEDVLPVVSNPSSRHLDDLKNRIWIDSTGPVSYAEELGRTRLLAEFGITNAIQGHLESYWRDGQESCTLRTRATPARGGNAALAAFIEGQKSLGWKNGLYANYLNIHSLSAYWDESLLVRDASLNWREGIPGHFLIKAPKAVELQHLLSPQIRESFHPSATYMGESSSVPPWYYTDYDARVPGAATYSQAYYCLGELFYRESELIGGPVLGLGGAESFYIGLLDGYLAGSVPKPYRPLYLLLRLQPLGCRFGAGTCSVPPNADDATRDAAVDAYLSAQIAYGAMGRLVPETLGAGRQARSFFMVDSLQKRYGGKIPKRIAYWNGEHFETVSEAIQSDALQRSQLYLSYDEDLEVWVNGHADQSWEVRVAGEVWDLPPSGWLAAATDFFEASARIGGQRKDYVEDGTLRFYDGRGSQQPFRGLSTSGRLTIRHIAEEGAILWDVVAGGDTGWIGLSGPELGRRTEGPDGVLVGSPGEAQVRISIREADSMYWFEHAGGLRRYQVRFPWKTTD